MLAEVDRTIESGENWSPSDVRDIVKKATHVFREAFDGEVLLMWERASGS